MAKDTVLQREMFNTRGRSAKGGGITSMVDDGSAPEMTREQRLQMAQEMLAEAQMKQNPEYYFNTLSQGDRPAMTRPVATSAPPPPMQPVPAMQQMAQMQAAGIRPVGMRHGGIARGEFANGGMVRHGYEGEDGSLVTPNGPMSYDELMAQYAESGNVDRQLPTTYMGPVKIGSFSRPAMLVPKEPLPTILGEDGKMRLKTRRDMPESLPFAKTREVTDAERGILSIKKPVETEKPVEETPTKKEEPSASPADKKQTELEQIKADRKAEKDKNFWLGLMQAGLATAAGKSPDALQNIAQGGISGLQSYAGLEADSRKAEREDMAALRAQQQDEATAAYRDATLALEKKKIEQDPDAIRLYKALGGGDLNKGYALTQDDENLKAAVAVSRDTMASPEAKSAAEQYIMSKIAPQNVVPATGSRIVGVQ